MSNLIYAYSKTQFPVNGLDLDYFYYGLRTKILK